MKFEIFYSWESDRPSGINKGLIQEAIQLAIERISGDDQISIEPVLDRDTLGLPGSPAIAQSIFEKIENCGLFLGDVTIVTEDGASRPSPNPNVLIELGYAAAHIGWERIICVMNQSYGEPKKCLPFDLQHRRWPILYRLSSDAHESKIRREKSQLSQSIELAVRTVINSGILVGKIDPKDNRVAVKFEGILSRFVAQLAAFLRENGLEDSFTMFQQTYQDLPGTKFPDPILVEPIMNILVRNNLKSPSNMRVGETQLNWAGAFIQSLREVAASCDQLLDRFSDRHDELITQVDEIQSRADQLAFMIETSFKFPQLSHLYDNGIPDMHLDWFRYFILSILKSYRIARQFAVT